MSSLDSHTTEDTYCDDNGCTIRTCDVNGCSYDYEGSGSSMPEDSEAPVEALSRVSPPRMIQYLLVNVPEEDDGKPDLTDLSDFTSHL